MISKKLPLKIFQKQNRSAQNEILFFFEEFIFRLLKFLNKIIVRPATHRTRLTINNETPLEGKGNFNKKKHFNVGNRFAHISHNQKHAQAFQL